MNDKIAYGLLAVANAVLTQLAVELGKGTVPIPASWAWAVPILGAGIVALTMLLPKIGGPPAEFGGPPAE